MNDGQLAELLDEAARLFPAGPPDATWLARYPEAPQALLPLLDVARAIAGLFVPVRPRPFYRAELRRGLIAAAHQQQVHRALVLTPEPAPAADLFGRLNALAGQGLEWAGQSIERAGQEFSDLSESDRRLVVVVGSAVSLGVIAYVLHARNRAAA